MRTRHLVGLISGVLILSVLLPVGLSIWLAHQQVETSFIEELDTYSSRVAIRANKVATQGKDALQELERCLLQGSTREEKIFYRKLLNLKLQLEQEKVIGELLL